MAEKPTKEDLEAASRILENLIHYPKIRRPRDKSLQRPRNLQHDLAIIAAALAAARGAK